MWIAKFIVAEWQRLKQREGIERTGVKKDRWPAIINTNIKYSEMGADAKADVIRVRVQS